MLLLIGGRFGGRASCDCGLPALILSGVAGHVATDATGSLGGQCRRAYV